MLRLKIVADILDDSFWYVIYHIWFLSKIILLCCFLGISYCFNLASREFVIVVINICCSKKKKKKKRSRSHKQSKKVFVSNKMPRQPASENVVCLCRLLNILANFSNLFLHTGKQCGPDQTAPRGAVWSGSTPFAKMTFKITSRWQSRRQLLWLAV